MSEQMGFKFETVSGHQLHEVISAFQKEVRRGNEENALYWAVELDLSNYANYAWKRMKIMSSEDIGLGEPSISSEIHALWCLWLEQAEKKDKKHFPERLYYVHAVLLLVRAKKSRIVDHALCVHYKDHANLRREIPDYALDKHTYRGKSMGRGFDHFFKEGIKLENKADLKDEYEDRARELFTKKPQF